MTFRIRKAIGVLAIAVLAGASLLGVGCGGSDDEGSERAVEWFAERAVGPKALRLAATVEACFEPVQLEQPIVEYSGRRVYLELRHTPEEKEYDGCLLSLWTVRRTVTFDRDLDELVIFDSSTDPPEQRWPRERLPGE